MDKRFIIILLSVLSVSLDGICADGFREPEIQTVAVDSAGIAGIRARMDSIRRSRPVVALVLSGGGAKGAAHIGAIKYIESIGMPVDMVLGTSMGGLVGGIYALGYSADELETIVRNIDWELALSDRIPREFISYSEKKYKEKYLLSFPFYYKKEYYLERKADEMRYSDRDQEELEIPDQFESTDVQRHEGKLVLGADAESSAAIVRDNILGSLTNGRPKLLAGLLLDYDLSLPYISRIVRGSGHLNLRRSRTAHLIECKPISHNTCFPQI